MYHRRFTPRAGARMPAHLQPAVSRALVAASLALLLPFAAAATPPGPVTPLEFLTEDVGAANRLDANGRLVGFSADVVQALCEQLQPGCAIDVLPWNRAYQRLLQQPDIALFATARIAGREGLMQWVGPLAVADWSFYRHHADTRVVQSLEDLKAATAIGVVRGDAREQYLLEMGFDNLVAANRPVSSAQQLALRRIDYWFIDNAALGPVLEEAKLAPEQFAHAFSARRICLYLALSTNVPAATVQRWQQALDALKADGRYAAIMAAGGYNSFSVLLQPPSPNDPQCAPGGAGTVAP
jgi:polar amino acid transport system substrate-binding protein